MKKFRRTTRNWSMRSAAARRISRRTQRVCGGIAVSTPKDSPAPVRKAVNVAELQTIELRKSPSGFRPETPFPSPTFREAAASPQNLIGFL